jgi:hypothetical protein
VRARPTALAVTGEASSQLLPLAASSSPSSTTTAHYSSRDSGSAAEAAARRKHVAHVVWMPWAAMMPVRCYLGHQNHRALPWPPRHSARHPRTRRTRRSADVAGLPLLLVTAELRAQARAKCAHFRRLRWPQVQPAASCYRSLRPHPRSALPPRAIRARLRLRPLLGNNVLFSDLQVTPPQITP